MPRYRYVGDGPSRYGMKELRKGDVVDASDRPGKNFVEVVEPEEPARRKRLLPEQPGPAKAGGE